MKALSVFGRFASNFGIVPLCMALAFSIFINKTLHAQNYQIATGDDFTAIIDSDNKLYTFGSNGSGQLGIGTIGGFSATIERVAPDKEWQAVAVSRSGDGSGASTHVLAIKTDGSLWAWGANESGQLGIGSTLDAALPVRIGSDTDWVEVVAGSNFSLARKQDGTVYAWGDNSYGQLGLSINDTNFQGIGDPNSTRNTYTTPREFDGGTPYIAIGAGPFVGLGIRSTTNSAPLSSAGAMYAWGYSSTLQLGKPASSPGGALTGPATLPQRIGSSNSWTKVFAGKDVCFALQQGQLYVWGGGGNTGTGTAEYTPTRVGSASNWASVSVGNDHTLALRSDGSLYGWGDNQQGELGLPLQNPDGSYLIPNFFITTPRQLEIGSFFTSVGAGADFSVLMGADGVVQSSGANDQGQLGNGNTSSTSDFGQTNLGAVDLSIESISYTADIETLSEGDTFQVQLIILNNGTGTVESSDLSAITYDLVLSQSLALNPIGALNPVVSPPDYIDTEIGPSSAIPVNFTLTVPEVSEGDYFIIAQVDSTGILEESDEDNNSASSDPDAPLPFRADLSVSFLNASPVNVDTEGTLNVELTFSNLGTGDILAGDVGEFAYRVILSEFDDESVGDVYELSLPDEDIDLVYSGGLDAGATSPALTIELSVPEEIDLSRSYFIGIVVDSSDAINESDESNNSDFSATTVISVNGLSIPAALDVQGDPNEPVFTAGGDSNWYGQPNVMDASGTENGAIRSPALEAGEFAAVTFSFAEPRELTFRWKSQTTSSENRLFLGANLVPLEPEGLNEPTYLFGNRDWSEVAFIVPKNTPVGFFYEQGTEAPSDRVFVDNLQISPEITEPDYIIESIDYTPGSYVLQRDRFSVVVTGINRGADNLLPGDFEVKVWLSIDQTAGDEDDVLLGALNSFQVLDNGSKFVYQADFILPETLLDAPYYVLARVDSSNVVAEYKEDTPFSPDDNNFRFTDEAGAVIDRRADLRVTNLVELDGATQQVPIFVGGPTDHPDYNKFAGENETKVFGQFIVDPIADESSEIALRFDIINDGLSAVQGLSQAFDVDVYFSTSRDADPADGFLLTTFTESSGLAVGGGRTYEITSNIPDTVDPGSFYYIAIVLDTSDAVSESDEDNNASFSPENEVFVGEVTLDVALNDNALDDPNFDDPNAIWESRDWVDGFEPSNSTNANPSSPWFGQTAVFGRDSLINAAAQSGPVRRGATTYMQTTVEVGNNPVQVSFQWKVSSQLTSTENIIIEDILQFSIRDGDSGPFLPIAKISGEIDWTLYRHTIEDSGTYTLRWSYIENGDDIRAGADAGWVDAFSAESPDFTLSVPGNAASVPGFTLNAPSGPLTGGDTLEVSFDTLNLGGVPFDRIPVQIRLSPTRGEVDNLNWNALGAEDIILFDGDAAIGATFSEVLEIPDSISENASYYLGVWLEYPKAIAENNESNNLAWTDTAVIDLEPAVTFSEATEFQPDPTNGWTLVGDGRWFPSVGEVHPDSDQQASVTNPEIDSGESAGFEAIIDGPRLLRFRWKADSRENLNYAEVRINGTLQRREFGPLAGSQMNISGDRDWREEYLLIPAGTQVVSWHYVKTSEPLVGQGDHVYVDWIQVLDVVDRPDLAILNVDYNTNENPDSGRQQYALERDQFPISVVVANRGATPAGFSYDDVDIEIRLSEDQNFDGSDEIIGNLGLTQVLQSGNRLIYSGNVDLPINIDDKNYYLLARVNSLDPNFQEYSININGTEYGLLENNTFVSDNQDVEILHLPRLDTVLKTLVNDKIYYPEEDLYLEWDLINIGLGDIDGLTPFETRIELWSFEAGSDYTDLDSAEKVTDLAVVTEQEYLPGALSRDDPSESTLSYKEYVKIPRTGQLLTDLGVIDGSPEDEDIEVTTNLDELSNYVFFFVIVRDTKIPQSSELAVRYNFGKRFLVTAVPDYGISVGEDYGTFWDYAAWADYQNSILSGADLQFGLNIVDVPDGLLDGDPSQADPSEANGVGASKVPYLYHYALNLPLNEVPGVDPSGLNAEPEDIIQSGTYRVRDGSNDIYNYRSITFPVVRGATDINYKVEISNDGGTTWELNPLVVIEPPYLDARDSYRAGYYGAQSLTLAVDEDSLINTLVENSYLGLGDTDKPIVSAVDQNYTAIVTVRDVIDLQSLVDDSTIASPDRRRLRVFVEQILPQNQSQAIMKSAILPPVIVNQSPEDIQVAEGDPLFLGVQAYGGDLTYEWFTTAEAEDVTLAVKESSNGTSLTIGSVDASHAGTYSVRISNSAGVLESAEMVVTVSDSGIDPPQTNWYDDAATLAGGWRYYDWFKAFKPESDNWIYHSSHGWLYTLGDSSSLFFWDAALGRWLWTSESVYPWIYVFGPQGGWFYFFEAGSSGARFFSRGDTGEILSEANLRNAD